MLERKLAVLAASALPPRVISYAADMFALYVGAFAYEESDAARRADVPEQLGAYLASLPPEQFPLLTRPRRRPDRRRHATSASSSRLDLLIRGLEAMALQ